MSLKSKDQTKSEQRIAKVFSIHDFQAYETCNDRRKLVCMEVTSTPKLELPIPTLARPENMVCFLKVRKAIMKLVTEHGWDWNHALECALSDGVATRIRSLKENIENLELTDDIKYQTAISFYISSECNVANPLQAQRLCFQKMRRYFLQDDDSMNPQQFCKVLQQANDLLPYMQPTSMTANSLDKLSEDDLMTAFLQSLPPD